MSIDASPAPQTLPATTPTDPDEAVAAFLEWTQGRGLTLYPHQEEALLELASGANVVLATPTGSGKSLVALAAHFLSLGAQPGSTTYYTAPIKALVSEKFFALCEAFGAHRVGMLTGDAAVNASAPIICCTAEVLANLSLRQGESMPVSCVVMDEFHFYSEPDRGWAWQVPLLTLPQAQFLLMSATLGDVTGLVEDLTRRTGRPTAAVTDAPRPVPLSFQYALTPLHETLEELLSTHQAPVYVVHFTQAAALERAQALLSVPVATRAERDEIAARIAGFRFGKGFGAILSKLVRHGVGVHHAGMLPKYRRLVETLAQAGLLKVICGTDTLGVGINVPIRTVLITGLTKFDGARQRLLKVREFHQIAGRAGRAGFDTAGTVVVQAPEHVIENHRALAKAGDDPKKRRKVQRKKAPEGFVSWGEETFDRVVGATPEPLISRMRVSHGLVLNVIERPGDPVLALRRLLTDNHEDPRRQAHLQRRAIEILRSLLQAGVVEKLSEPDPTGRTLRVVEELQRGFALNQPLSTFALAVIDLLDPESPDYALDVVSVIESTLDDPRPVLLAQQFKARGEAVAQMKADGIEYDERMELLEEVTWPRPLAELLDAAFETFRASSPWLREDDLSPKSVVRDLYERAMTFGEFVAFYGLARSEGVVLRYLSDAYRALRSTVPEAAKSEHVRDIQEWLGELVRQTDSSLLDEWEALTDPDRPLDEPVRPSESSPRPLSANERALRVLVRTALWRRVDLAARGRVEELAALDAVPTAAETAAATGALPADGLPTRPAGPEPLDARDWAEGLIEYAADYGVDAHIVAGSDGGLQLDTDLLDVIGTGPDARGPGLLRIVGEGRRLLAEQILADPDGDRDWRIFAEVDLDATDELGELVLTVTDLDRATA
ncbi:superfamily II RNA helicase [Kineosphaera limosa]|uniref:Putative helicase n=1 Tax=Kineosphaera limosa NBRC 100340 TaxID=1184609 RepID=K6WPY7_9MICO|nr:DEAD/DEAH box helicase [Kineosphaera limosa]NYD99765.1 superfamily II RNA helicase [Kineosphaera limosa]GAB95866.1 putative helicase [Kineosphaera limosa NBRC 100340]